MTYKFSQRSLRNLSGVHPDLVRVVNRALDLTPVDFIVIEGLRTEARQRQLLAAGATTTMRSRHLTGHAVDLAPIVAGQIRWDWPLFHKIAPAVKQAARDMNVAIEWGGDWKTFVDGPHWQLPWSVYS